MMENMNPTNVAESAERQLLALKNLKIRKLRKYKMKERILYLLDELYQI